MATWKDRQAASKRIEEEKKNRQNTDSQTVGKFTTVESSEMNDDAKRRIQAAARTNTSAQKITDNPYTVQSGALYRDGARVSSSASRRAKRDAGAARRHYGQTAQAQDGGVTAQANRTRNSIDVYADELARLGNYFDSTSRETANASEWNRNVNQYRDTYDKYSKYLDEWNGNYTEEAVQKQYDSASARAQELENELNSLKTPYRGMMGTGGNVNRYSDQARAEQIQAELSETRKTAEEYYGLLQSYNQAHENEKKMAWDEEAENEKAAQSVEAAQAEYDAKQKAVQDFGATRFSAGIPVEEWQRQYDALVKAAGEAGKVLDDAMAAQDETRNFGEKAHSYQYLVGNGEKYSAIAQNAGLDAYRGRSVGDDVTRAMTESSDVQEMENLSKLNGMAKNMTEDEIASYYYLAEQEGSDAAADYLAYMTYVTDARAQEKNREWWQKAAKVDQDSGALASSLASIPASLASGVGAIDLAVQRARKKADGDDTPLNFNTMWQTPYNVSSTIRGTVSGDLNEMFGTLPDSTPIIGGQGLGELYQLVMSAADSAAAGALTAGAGSLIGGVSAGAAAAAASRAVSGSAAVILGGSAATSAMQQAHAMGASDKEAFTYGLLSGTFETLFEYVSLDHLLSGTAPANLSETVKSVLAQAGVEASEEFCTTVANTLVSEPVLGELSDFNQKVQGYIAQGYSETDAKKMASADTVEGALSDALGGFLSGGLMGGGYTAINYAGASSYGGELSRNGINADALIEEVRNIPISEDLPEFRVNAAEEAKAFAEKIADGTYPQSNANLARLSDMYNAAVGSVFATADLSESIRERQSTEQDSTEQIPEQIRKAAQEYRKAGTVTEAAAQTLQQDEAALSYLVEHGLRTSEGDFRQQAARILSEVAQPVKATGITTETEAAQNGNIGNGAIRALDVRDGKVSLQLERDGGVQRVSLEEAQIPEELKEHIENAAEYGEAATAYFKGIKADQDIGRYSTGWEVAYQLGKEGVSEAVVDGFETARYLTPAQRVTAYEMGKRAGGVVSEARRPGGKGVVTTGAFSYGGTTYNGVSEESMADQKVAATVRVMTRLAETYGFNVRFFESQENAQGKYEGENGFYSDWTIYLDVHAGKASADSLTVGILRTAGHELTHYLREISPEVYRELQQFVLEHIYQKAGGTLEELVRQKQQEYYRQKGKELSLEDAMEEVVADGCEMVLADENLVQRMQQENRSLWEKVKAWVKEFIDDLKEIIRDLNPNSAEARLMQDSIDRLRDIWLRGLTPQQGNENAAQTRGGVKYSTRQSFSEQVDDVLSDKFPRGNAVYVGQTPTILADVGLDGTLPMLTTARHIRNAVLEVNQKRHTHGLTEGQIKALPAQIAAPVMVLDSMTDENSVVVVTDLLDAEWQPVIVAIKADGSGTYNNVEVKSNFLTSYYGRRNFADFIRRVDDADGILYVDQKKSHDLSSRASVQFAGQLEGLDSNTILRKARAAVNRENASSAETMFREAVQSGDEEDAQRIVLELEGKKYSLREIDEETKEWLESLSGDELITTYRSMQLIDGKLYPPMAAVVNGTMEDPSVIGSWERAVEHPDLVKIDQKTGKAKFTLNKGKRQGSLDAAYNPYMHSSNLMLNDQFTGAYRRENLVTVECVVPASENSSGYRAEYAKDSTGWHDWHAGPVASRISEQRQVFLSRWLKPVRILSDAEVAQEYQRLLDGTNVAVPYNVVSPSLLNELEKIGVPIDDRGSGKVPARKFSLRSGAEETKDLLALHNLTEENLRNVLKLGGFPMPSIAVVKAAEGHSKYGPISLVLSKTSIDPEVDSRNHIYGADAYTPTAPEVEYQVNYDRLLETERRINELAEGVAGGIFSNSSLIRSLGIEDESSMSTAQLAERLAIRDTVRAAYLADQGRTLEPVMQDKEWNKYGNDTLQMLIDRIGISRLAEINAEFAQGPAVEEALGADADTIRDLLREYYRKSGEGMLRRMAARNGWTQEEAQAQGEARVERAMERNVTPFTLEQIARDAWDFYEDGGQTSGEIDRMATHDKLMEETDRKQVQAWVQDQMDGLLGEAGIYNGRDRYTASGNRRSFEALHYAYTAENIVRAMTETQEQRGEMVFAPNATGLMATATPEYGSISEVKQDSGRIQTVDDDAYKARLDEIDDRIGDVITKVRRQNKPHSDNSFEEMDIIGSILVRAASGKKTQQAIIRAFSKEGYTIDGETANMIRALYSTASEMPTGYFEAKPERVVQYDEVLAVVVPDNLDAGLMEEITAAGMPVRTYAAGDEQSRLEAVNAVPEAKFSLRETEDGTRFVQIDVDQERFDGLTLEEMMREARKVILEKFRGRVIGVDYKAYVDRRSAEEFSHPANRRLDKKVKSDKMRASTELDNLIKSGTYLRNEIPDGDSHPEATGGIDKLLVRYVVADRAYEGEASIIVTDRGKRFHDITKIKDITQREIGQAMLSTAAKTPSDVSTTEYATENGNVKTKFSLRKTEHSEAAQKEIDRLRRSVERWKRETKVTKTAEVRETDVRRVAQELTNTYGLQDSVNTEDLERRITDFANRLLNWKDGESTQNVMDLAYQIGAEVAENATVTVQGAEAEAIAQQIKRRTLYLSPENRADVGENWSAFQKQYRNSVKFTNDSKKGLYVDIAYAELQQTYGEGYFPADIINPGDQAQYLATFAQERAAARTEPLFRKPTDIDSEAAEIAANLVMAARGQQAVTGLTAQLRKKADTFADKAKARLEKERAKGRAAVKEAKEAGRRAVKETRKTLQEEKREAVQEAKDIGMRKVEREARSTLMDELEKRGIEDVGSTVAEQNNLRQWRKKYQELLSLRAKQREERKVMREADGDAKVKSKNRIDLLETQIQRADEALRSVESQERMKKVIRRTIQAVEAQEAAERRRAVKEVRTRQSNRKLRDRIVKHTTALSKRLLQPTDTRHVPETLRNAVAKTLDAINLEAERRGKPTKRAAAFAELRKQYQEILKNGEALVVDPDLAEHLDAVSEMRNVRLDEMTAEQLQTVWEAIRAVEHSIASAGKALSSAQYKRISDWADAYQDEAESRREKRSLTPGHFMLNQETPITFFSHFGEAGEQTYRMLRDAQDHQQVMTDELRSKVEAVLGENPQKLIREMRRDVQTFQFDDERSLTLNAAQRANLYNLAQREAGRRHILGGGIVQPEVKVQTGKLTRTIRRGTKSVRLSEGDLNQILDTVTEEQVTVANGLQQLAGLLAEWGNEASLAAYGYRKFTDPHYWKITAAREQTQKTVENSPELPASIKNVASAKSLVPQAANGIECEDVFDVFSQSAAEMIAYSAWLVPMEDINRLYNYNYSAAAARKAAWENGTTFNEEKAKLPGTDTFSGLLQRVAGDRAQDYWEQLMKDIQTGIGGKTDETVSMYAQKLFGNAKKASVGGNIRVVVQQPTAIIRALAVMSPKDLSRGIAGGVEKGSGWRKAVQYSPIAARKSAGGFDISRGRQMGETLYGTANALDKISNALAIGAEKADAITWGYLWNACERSVAAKTALKPGSDAFHEAVNRMFSDVIDQTQVVDGVLQRSQAMRSSNPLVKYMTAFMGEPTMSLNLMMRSVDQMLYQKDGAKRKAAGQAVARSAAALVATSIINGVVKSLIDAMRDDDKDRSYWEKWWDSFRGINPDEENAFQKILSVLFDGNALSDINPLQQIPLLKDFVSIAQGYDVSRMDMDAAADAYDAAKELIAAFTGNSRKTVPYALERMMAQVGKLAGLSFGNIARDSWALMRTVVSGAGNYYLEYQMEKAIRSTGNSSNRSQFWNILYRALEGDETQYNRIREDMLDGGAFTENEIADAMLKKIQNAYADGTLDYDRAIDLYTRVYIPDAKETKEDVENEAYFRFLAISDKEAYLAEHGSTDGFASSDYRRLDTAIESGGDVEAEISDLVAHGYKEDQVQKRVASKVGELYREDQSLSESDAERLLQEYADYDADDADAKVLEWDCYIETGYTVGELDDAYLDGDLTESQVRGYLQKYDGLTADGLENHMAMLKLKKENPEFDGDLTSAQASTWYSEIRSTGMSLQQYADALDFSRTAHADLDANGEAISGSKKAKVVTWIDAQSLTQTQKDTLYLTVFGYAPSTLYDTPWH